MRYQTAPDAPGTFPTAEWFAALLRGIDGPLGTVLDVGCAEGVMSVMAAQAGGIVDGIDTNLERLDAAYQQAVAAGVVINLWARPSTYWNKPRRTVILSMIAHWVGREETCRLAGLAQRNVAVIFRLANDHYSIPENGTWFPTLAELDETISGVRTHEELLLTQDSDKQVWAATYRTDITVMDGMVYRTGREPMPLREGRDLHGDQPFRPTNGAPLAILTNEERAAVRRLAREVALDALALGMYPTDFAPRNVIVGPEGAFLVDRDPAEDEPYIGGVSAKYLPIWQATLRAAGVEFHGDLQELV